MLIKEQEIDARDINNIVITFKELFDVVRIVEPHTASIINVEDNHVTECSKTPCFSIWEKNKKCDNCISFRACYEKDKVIKFEFRDKEVYNVISIPFYLIHENKKTHVALELVNHLDENVIYDAYGKGTIEGIIKSIDNKIYRDSLTKIYNRRYFDEYKYIFDTGNKLPNNVAFIMIDVDKFKYVNDTYGHECGDDILKEIAHILKKNIRRTDNVMRFGGDEFIIALKDCNEDIIYKKVDNIKRDVNNIYFNWLKEFKLSVSVGIAYTDKFDGTKDQLKILFKEADKNMYIDKGKVNKEGSLLYN